MTSKLVGHWPTLLALVLAGFTIKLGTLKLALLAGEVGWALGVAILASALILALFGILTLDMKLDESRKTCSGVWTTPRT